MPNVSTYRLPRANQALESSWPYAFLQFSTRCFLKENFSKNLSLKFPRNIKKKKKGSGERKHGKSLLMLFGILLPPRFLQPPLPCALCDHRGAEQWAAAEGPGATPWPTAVAQKRAAKEKPPGTGSGRTTATFGRSEPRVKAVTG